MISIGDDLIHLNLVVLNLHIVLAEMSQFDKQISSVSSICAPFFSKMKIRLQGVTNGTVD